MVNKTDREREKRREYIIDTQSLSRFLSNEIHTREDNNIMGRDPFISPRLSHDDSRTFTIRRKITHLFVLATDFMPFTMEILGHTPST